MAMTVFPNVGRRCEWALGTKTTDGKSNHYPFRHDNPMQEVNFPMFRYQVVFNFEKCY
jgi:hypothetical protein